MYAHPRQDGNPFIFLLLSSDNENIIPHFKVNVNIELKEIQYDREKGAVFRPFYLKT